MEFAKEIYKDLQEETAEAFKDDISKAIKNAIQLERHRALNILELGGTREYMLKLVSNGTDVAALEADAAIEVFGE